MSRTSQISGWSVSYVATWNPDDWHEQADAWMHEAQHVLRPGGYTILFKSWEQEMKRLSDYRVSRDSTGWLAETEFMSRWIRTDYRFDSPEQAEQLAGFFFGEEMKTRIRNGPPITLPECTGVWWKNASDHEGLMAPISQSRTQDGVGSSLMNVPLRSSNSA